MHQRKKEGNKSQQKWGCCERVSGKNSRLLMEECNKICSHTRATLSCLRCVWGLARSFSSWNTRKSFISATLRIYNTHEKRRWKINTHTHIYIYIHIWTISYDEQQKIYFVQSIEVQRRRQWVSDSEGESGSTWIKASLAGMSAASWVIDCCRAVSAAACPLLRRWFTTAYKDKNAGIKRSVRHAMP